MATKQIYIGSQGPYLYDDSSDVGMSPDQVVTKGDMELAIDLTQDQRDLMTALLALVGNGLIVRTGANSFAIRQLEGTANEVEITYPDGYTGNPKIGLPTAITVGSLTVDQIDLKQIVYTTGTDKTGSHKVPVLINGVTYYILLQAA